MAVAGISVDDTWVREPAVGQTTAVGYGVVTNETDEVITLIGASAPIGGTFEVHQTSVADDGTMSMGEQEGGFQIAPGESLTLEPGGAHIMMLGIDPDEFSGPLDLTFVFDSEQITTSAELREIGDGADDESHEGHGDDEGHEGHDDEGHGDEGHEGHDDESHDDEMEDMDEMEDDVDS